MVPGKKFPGKRGQQVWRPSSEVPGDFQEGMRRLVCPGSSHSLVMHEVREEGRSVHTADSRSSLDVILSERQSHGVEFESGSDMS